MAILHNEVQFVQWEDSAFFNWSHSNIEGIQSQPRQCDNFLAQNLVEEKSYEIRPVFAQFTLKNLLAFNHLDCTRPSYCAFESEKNPMVLYPHTSNTWKSFCMNS